MEKQFQFKTNEIESQLKNCAKNGITELSVHDSVFADDKNRIIKLFRAVLKDAPQLFVSVKVNSRILDSQLCEEALNINCSLELDFKATDKGFDKKHFSKKCMLLNNMGLVFGANLFYADNDKDSLKLFKDRLDFTVQQYPNHIDFPQLETAKDGDSGKTTAFFSGQDIRYARNIAFAARTFYSSGRAVTWFNSVLQALKISASSFFADFAEWQRVNNCDYKSGFIPEGVSHQEIEKMQLVFLNLKLEEKRLHSLSAVVNDIVKINGALSRLVAEGEQAVLETEYNPEDLLGPESMDLRSFSNDVCMEHCKVQLFINEDGEPDFKVL